MKRNLLSVLIVALVIVNIVLSAIMMMSVTNTNKRTAELITDIATVMNLELTSPGEAASALAASNVSIEDRETYNLEEMTIPLAIDSDGKQYHMVCRIGLSINKGHPDYKKKASLITGGGMDSVLKDTIITVVSSYTKSEADANASAQLKAEILDAVQKLIGSDLVFEIVFDKKQFG